MEDRKNSFEALDIRISAGHHSPLATRMGRRSNGTRRILETVWPKVTERLAQDWSPEQISNRMRLDGTGSVSHESIYAFIESDRKAGGELHKKLRRYGKKRNATARSATATRYPDAAGSTSGRKSPTDADGSATGRST